MVIICPECTTKFRIDPERIPDKGAKVRCARCKHVFIAQKPELEAQTVPPVVEPSMTPEPEQTADFFSAEVPPEAPVGQDQFSESFEETIEEDSSFSYENFHDLDNTESADDFTFDSDTEDDPVFAKEHIDTGESIDQTPADDDDFTFGESDAEEWDAETETTQPSEATAAKSTPEVALADSPAEQEIPSESETRTAPPAAQKSSALSSLIRILLLLILGILILGGVLVYMNGPESVQQTLQQLLGHNSAGPVQTGRVTLDKLEGKFVNNQEAGELFVIRGEATNQYPSARGAIQVKGVIFDKDGKPLLQKTIFCGNPITDQELQTLPFSKLEEMMGNQFGKSLSNMKVDSKQALPFVIAFRDLPKTLSEFSVDVTSSEAAAQ